MAISSIHKTLQNLPQPSKPWMGTGTGTVEGALIWAYQVQQAGRGGARRAGPVGYRSAWGGIQARAALGVAVDCSGGAGDGEGNDTAEWIAERVAALPGLVAVAVIEHARAGTRPELCEQAPVLVPVRGENGRALISYLDGAARRKPWLCPLRLCPLPEERELARAAWVEWWDALDLLALQIGADPLDVPREPWGVDSGDEI